MAAHLMGHGGGGGVARGCDTMCSKMESEFNTVSFFLSMFYCVCL